MHQVEYALEAVKQGSAVVGLRSKTHAVLVALKRAPSELASYQRKVLKIDHHLGMGFAGLTSDARVLSHYMRQLALSSRLMYTRPLPVSRLMGSLADRAQLNTMQYGKRPYGVGFLVINVLVSWWVSRRVTLPVQQAARAAESLSSGNLAVRMPVDGEDEMARLGMSFNRMADSIQDQIGQLAQLSQMQQRFVSDVSHELRTPLTTVRMAADVLYGSREDFDPVSRRSTELLYHQVDRFQAMLADLLEITRFDAGAATPALEATDMLELARDVVLTSQPLADQIGVPVYMVPMDRDRADGHVAWVDPRRIERILRNLVNNAIEHAEGRPVDVLVAADEEAVTFAVVDHGIGMSPEQVQRVFDRFWRADPARKRTTGGSGLGLAIVAAVVAQHGGRVDVRQTDGGGATFRVAFPLAEARDGLKAKRFSARELTQAHVTAVERARALNAYILETPERALAMADASDAKIAAGDKDKAREELGDLLFVVANLARKLDVEPEDALRGANAKFVRRFGFIEAELARDGRTPDQSTLEEMDRLWDAAKAAEKPPS